MVTAVLPSPLVSEPVLAAHITMAMAEPFGHHRCEILVRPGDPAAGAHSIARRRGCRLGRLAAAQCPGRPHDELAELDDADVGRAEMLARAVLDRTLAVLDGGVLLAHTHDAGEALGLLLLAVEHVVVADIAHRHVV